MAGRARLWEHALLLVRGMNGVFVLLDELVPHGQTSFLVVGIGRRQGGGQRDVVGHLRRPDGGLRVGAGGRGMSPDQRNPRRRLASPPRALRGLRALQTLAALS
jgi:hypothetical protein